MRVLDTVVLNNDLSTHGLRRNDVGIIVEVYKSDGIEVEFIAGSGRTQALVTLKSLMYILSLTLISVVSGPVWQMTGKNNWS